MSGHERDVWVLDCSRVATPEEFWQAYVRELPVEGAEYFGKNLHALWDALSGGGPGFPGAIHIELHNVERLAGYNDGAFVQALRKLADRLADSNATVSLRVL
jgi:RNAse (barnase) inhibitor barstar